MSYRDEHRQLAAIMFTDIVGFTALMSESEASALDVLRRSRLLVRQLTRRFRGRWLETVGDGNLIRFASATDAVNCALTIQKRLLKDADIRLRIGIHVGDVIEAGGHIYGDGVNVASRIEGLAEPGGIVVSETVYDAVRNKAGIRADKLGAQHLEGLDHPMQAYALSGETVGSPLLGRIALPDKRRWGLALVLVTIALAGILSVGIYTRYADVQSGNATIAVLPFADLSPGGDQKYFADGLSEEILNSLNTLSNLLVTARTSSFFYKDKDVPVDEIAERLGVAHVLEGSVRRSGKRLRVTAQLVRASDGFHLWSNTYDAQLEDVFQIQTDVAEKVAGALSIYLDDEQREALAASGTRNVEAFQAFLKGRELFDQAHAGEPGVSLWDANEAFERAMALDPSYVAPAIAHHDAFAHYLIDGPDSPFLKEPRGRGPTSEEEALERLFADLDRAVRNAPTPTVRIVVELNREFFSRSWNRMPGLLKRLREEDAIEEVSGFEVWLPNILLLNGEFEMARRLSDHEIKTDPLNADIWSQRARLFLALSEFDAAEDAIERGRALAGDHPFLDGVELFLAMARHDKDTVLALLRRLALQQSEWGAAYLAAVEGDYERATALAEKIDAADPWAASLLLIVYHETGDKARARALTKRIDDLAAGPATLAWLIPHAHNTLFFDPADAPNFSARLKEAGIDLASFRPMPRLSVGAEEE